MMTGGTPRKPPNGEAQNQLICRNSELKWWQWSPKSGNSSGMALSHWPHEWRWPPIWVIDLDPGWTKHNVELDQPWWEYDGDNITITSPTMIEISESSIKSAHCSRWAWRKHRIPCRSFQGSEWHLKPSARAVPDSSNAYWKEHRLTFQHCFNVSVPSCVCVFVSEVL